MFRGRDVHEIEELKMQGFSLRAISDLTGYDRKTIRKYLISPEAVPVYGPRPKPESKLDPFKEFLQERMRAGVWNAQVLLREIRQRNYAGGYTILTDWLRPQRESARVVAVRRLRPRRVSRRKSIGAICDRCRRTEAIAACGASR